MSSITYIKGDATDPQAKGPKIIAHICNNMGGWGKGFVVAISKRWKEPEADYRDWYKNGPDFELGNVRYVKVRKDIIVANMIAQQGMKTGSKGPPIRYEALRKCLIDVHKIAKEHNASVHAPRIGTGLAGGSWGVIGPMIEEIFNDDVRVFVYDYQK